MSQLLNSKPVFLQAEDFRQKSWNLMGYSIPWNSGIQGPAQCPNHSRHLGKIPEKSREIRAWMDRVPFGHQAMIRGISGQILIARRFFFQWRCDGD